MTRGPLFTVGLAELVAGNVEAALPPFEEVLDRTATDPVRRADALLGIGQAHRARGDAAAARAAFQESVVLSRAWRNVGLMIGGIEMLALLELDEGRLETGVRVLGTGRSLRREAGGGPPVEIMFFGDALDRARDALGADAMEALMAEGERLTLDQALDLVGVARETTPGG